VAAVLDGRGDGGINIMRSKLLVILISAAATGLVAAAPHPNFSGTWALDSAKSRNIGMMAQANMRATVVQSDTSLDVTTHTSMQGRDDDSRTHYDLNGRAVTNQAPMGGPSQTVSKWDGDRLVTTWTSENALAGGPKIIRTETRSLSADGRTMTVELARGGSSMVMVFERK
jgi:hypothetical protein